MKVLDYDIEADGLLEDVTRIHCICTKDLITGVTKDFYGESLSEVGDYILPYDVLVGHNIIGYDNHLLSRFFGLCVDDKVSVDTLIMSQTLNPDRKLPVGCPTSVKNPLTNRLEKIGPHSLAAWGYRVGRYKPEHYDWSVFSKDMLNRCKEDVEIQELTLMYLLKEGDIDLIDLSQNQRLL